MNIKEMYETMKVNLRVDKDIRGLFLEELKLGKIIKIASYSKDKFSTCDAHSPSEYFSKDNIIEEIGVLTDTSEKYVIRQEYLGLNFEAPCDKYVFYVFDRNDYMIAETADLDNYIAKKEKQKRKVKHETRR